jgi:hypothetical protein
MSCGQISHSVLKIIIIIIIITTTTTIIIIIIIIKLGCIQKFMDCPPGARTANGTAPCH